jgi:hypothetical protein
MKPAYHPVRTILLALCALTGIPSALAGTSPGNDGGMILRMCRGADKVKALSVMCHSYLNGFMDGARYYAKDDKLTFCLMDGDKEKVSGVLVDWIAAHPESQTQPAGAVLQKALSEHFPCKGRK